MTLKLSGISSGMNDRAEWRNTIENACSTRKFVARTKQMRTKPIIIARILKVKVKNQIKHVIMVFRQLLELDFTNTNLGSPAFAFTIVDGINKGSVVPVLNHIVWAIMNLYFNCITSIINQKYNGPLSTSNHC